MGKLRLVYDQLEIFQVLQSSPTPQTSNWSGTIFCRFLQQTGSSRNPPKYFYQCLQCSSADGDRLVRWDARDAAFFFRKQVARGSRVAVEEKALAPSKQAWLLWPESHWMLSK